MKKKKMNWFNKLFIYLSDLFIENVDYSVELQNRLRLSRFLYSQRCLLAIIIFPILLLHGTYLVLYQNPTDNNVFSVNYFDMLSVISTYLGTSFLAIVVWHNSWLQQREKENESAIRILTNIEINVESGNCVFQDKNLSRIHISFINQNHIVPISVKYIKSFYLDKTKVLSLTPKSVSFENEEQLLTFNEKKSFKIGFDNTMLDEPRHFYFGFSVSNAYGHKVYCIIDCPIDKNGWCSELEKNGILIDVNKFKELKEKFGYDFLKEIVWYSPSGFNRKSINRVYMFKRGKRNKH